MDSPRIDVVGIKRFTRGNGQGPQIYFSFLLCSDPLRVIAGKWVCIFRWIITSYGSS